MLPDHANVRSGKICHFGSWAATHEAFQCFHLI